MQGNGREPGGQPPRNCADPDIEQSADTGDDSDNPGTRLDASAQALIGQQLQAVYSAIVRQPVPDQLLKLLDELEQKENGR